MPMRAGASPCSSTASTSRSWDSTAHRFGVSSSIRPRTTSASPETARSTLSWTPVSDVLRHHIGDTKRRQGGRKRREPGQGHRKRRATPRGSPTRPEEKPQRKRARASWRKRSTGSKQNLCLPGVVFRVSKSDDLVDEFEQTLSYHPSPRSPRAISAPGPDRQLSRSGYSFLRQESVFSSASAPNRCVMLTVTPTPGSPTSLQLSAYPDSLGASGERRERPSLVLQAAGLRLSCNLVGLHPADKYLTRSPVGC